MARRALTALVAVLAFGLAAVPAHAGEAEVRVSWTEYHGVVTNASATLIFRGDPSVNRLAVVEDGPDYVLTDSASPITAGDNCDQIDASSVRCHPAPFGAGGQTVQMGPSSISIALGDAADQADTTGVADVPVSVSGGEGADQVSAGPLPTQYSVNRLSGGPGDDKLTGGPANDILSGGPGTDTLAGTGGDDTLSDDDGRTVATDSYDGGEGVDAVTYASRKRKGVLIDLAAGRAGTGDEKDTLAAVENADGTPGADVLRGSAGPSSLTGGAGDDLLEGGGGGDALHGGTGTDRVRGGSGADKIFTGDPERVRCGRGEDMLEPEYVDATVPRDCEQVALGHFGAHSILTVHPFEIVPPKLRGLAVTCAPDAQSSCTLTLKVSASSGPAGSRTTRDLGRVEVEADADGRPHAFDVPLKGRALRAARAEGRMSLKIRARVSFRDEEGRRSAWSEVLRPEVG